MIYPSQERLRERFEYDSEQGLLVSIHSNHNQRRRRRTGVTSPKDYRRTHLEGRYYCHHRLVWIWHHGAIDPEILVDHINRDRHDDRIENLRLATASQNNAHSAMSRSNTSGYKGVTFGKKEGKWKAQIRVNYKKKHLGHFPTKEEAAAAYQKAAAEMHGTFAGAVS